MSEEEQDTQELEEDPSEEAPEESVEAAAAGEASAEETQSGEEAPAEEEVGKRRKAENNPNLRWYVVHTNTGFENKARVALEERIVAYGMEDRFGEILIPSENVVELVKGRRRTSSRKFFPGYVLVQMELNEKTWHLVKSTPKVTGFVGGKTDPPSIPDEEVARLTQQITAGSLKPKPKVLFEKGENVRVIDGPFTNFSGVVEEVKPDKGKIRVLVSIFGRATPVELEFLQVEKV